MHDKHGNEIEIGDIVTGWGFNEPHAVTGPVVALEPSAETCNITVAFVVVRQHAHGTKYLMPSIGVEYGTARDFEIVCKANTEKRLLHGPYAGYRSSGAHRSAFGGIPPVATTPAPEPGVTP